MFEFLVKYFDNQLFQVPRYIRALPPFPNSCPFCKAKHDNNSTTAAPISNRDICKTMFQVFVEYFDNQLLQVSRYIHSSKSSQ